MKRVIYHFQVGKQPGWVVKTAAAAMVIVALAVLIPLALFSLAALGIGLVVFFVLALVATIARKLGFRGSGPPAGRGAQDGRRNVRVIRDEESL